MRDLGKRLMPHISHLQNINIAIYKAVSGIEGSLPDCTGENYCACKHREQ